MNTKNMKKIFKFDKRDNSWELCKFYKIYMKDEVKMIKFFGMTDRCDTGKNYLSWICVYCKDDCEMPIEDFLLWDSYYQLDHLMENCEDNYEVELEPYECFEQVNKWVLADGNGSYFKKILDLTECTPCGYYYGY